jgi:vacuolar iron transporter family protein
MRGELAGRPENGLPHYLRDIVYGAVDGVVTTLAVVGATTGAGFDARIGIVLGLANLAADGLSMGASNNLGLKSELEQRGRRVDEEMPWRHGLATSGAFAVVGAVPLLAYLVPRPANVGVFPVALGLAIFALCAAGSLRARFTRRSIVRSALETVAVGAIASSAAYLAGAMARVFLGQVPS